MRPLTLSPSPHPACTRLLWQCQQLERCLVRLLELIDMAVIDAPGEVGEELASTMAQAQRYVGVVWDGAEDMWPR